MKESSFHDWDTFKVVLTKKFGLSDSQIKEAFFNMTLGKHEDPNDFILRVELKRQRYKFDKELCFMIFKK